MYIQERRIKNGNSSASRLNKNIMEKADLQNNDSVIVSFNQESGKIIIEPQKNDVHSNFYNLLNSSMKSDKEVLDFLKDK